jgi:hypothetical protein
MLTIIVSVVAGAWAALAVVALGAAQPLALAAGAVCFLLTVGVTGIVARRGVAGYAQGHKPKFPTPVEGGK